MSLLASLSIIAIQLINLCGLYGDKLACRPLFLSIVPKPDSVTQSPSRAQANAAPRQEEVLTNESVIQLLKAGLGEDLIIAKIHTTKHKFDTSTKGIIELKQAGASSRLIRLVMDPSQSAPASSAFEAPRPEDPPQAGDNGPNQSIAAETARASASTNVNPIAPERAASSDEFKRLIKSRYGDKVLVLMVNGMYAGETGKGFLSGAGDTKLQYLHYHPSVPIPSKKRTSPFDIFGKKTNEMDQVDERTLGILESAQAVPLQRGDPLKVDRIHVLSDRIEFNLISTSFRSLRQIDLDKSSKETRTTVTGSETTRRVKIPNLGFRFKFFFSKDTLKFGDYRTVVSEINKYLLPQEEAKGQLDAEKDIRIDPGMSEEEVIKGLGQPLKTISSGETKTLIYEDMKVVLKNGKVVELKVD